METLERNRRAFSAQVASFSADGHTFGDIKDIDWMLADLPLSSDFIALDVASGTGEFARALAQHVASVTALEATQKMRKRGEELLSKAGVDNVNFTPGVAEQLPFRDGSFEIVASRYAMHHFADPKPVLSEMARVCKPGGYLITVDIVAPGGVNATSYDYYEWIRDYSHTRCLRLDELQSLYGFFGFELLSARSRVTETSVQEWLDFAFTPETQRKILLDAVHHELTGGAETGLSPFERDSMLFFRQTDAAVLGRKI